MRVAEVEREIERGSFGQATAEQWANPEVHLLVGRACSYLAPTWVLYYQTWPKQADEFVWSAEQESVRTEVAELLVDLAALKSLDGK